VAAVTADVLSGRPVVYTTFLAYDEVAHHSGLERADTLAVLRRFDRAIARIAAAVPHAPRPYRLVVLSDHGQSQGATFRQRYGESLDELVSRHGAARDVRGDGTDADTEALGSLNAGLTELASRQTATGHALRTATRGRTDGEVSLAKREAEAGPPEISVMASGTSG
jgi:Type I phosphodiesterase / nucleotide pyrophosphatase